MCAWDSMLDVRTGRAADMENKLELFIRSLLSDRLDIDSPVVPDGICDYSEIADLIEVLTRDGRAVYSNDPYSYATMMGRVLSELFLKEQTDEERQIGVIGMSLMFACILETAVEVCGDTTAEEIIMIALNLDRIRGIRRHLGALPYSCGDDGKIYPNFASLPVFAKARPITMQQRDGFARRHLVPTLPDLFVDDEDEKSEVETDPPRGTFRSEPVDPEDLENAEADQFNGFEDFYDHFWENQYKAYEEGTPLGELLGQDDNEDGLEW